MCPGTDSLQSPIYLAVRSSHPLKGGTLQYLLKYKHKFLQHMPHDQATRLNDVQLLITLQIQNLHEITPQYSYIEIFYIEDRPYFGVANAFVCHTF